MRILQLIPNFGLAGAETMCENLTCELIKQGHDVSVVSLYNYHSTITKRIEKAGIDLVYLDKTTGLDFGLIKRLRKYIKDFKPDVIHTHLYALKYVAIASIGLPIKGIVHTVHNIAQKENNAANRFVNRLLFKKKNIIPVALTNEIRTTINQVYKLPLNEIPIVFNGTQIRNEYRKDSYEFGEKIRIINVGRYTPVKNQLALIEAVSRLHEEDSRIELDIYGDGPLKEQINQRLKELNTADYIKENGLTDNILEKLIHADIFVLPSIYEGMPMTIIEAMAVGLPVIGSKVGGIPDMIRDGENGLLCGTDIDSIELTIRKIINDNQQRENIAKNALERVKDFSAEQMAKSYIKIYSNLG